MRVALVDPLAYTPPYDHELAAALARRGHEVTLLTSPFLHGDAPSPAGYAREELFLPLSSRLLARSPRSRLRRAVKALEYGPGFGMLLNRLKRLDPDVVHVQWLPRPELDERWVGRLGRPSVLTAHDVVPRRKKALDAWPGVLGLFGRVVVHSQRAVARLRELDVANVVRIPHPVFESGASLPPPTGSTLLFFGLIREYKGLDVLVRALAEVPDAHLVVAGDPVDPVAPVRALARELGVDGRIDWRLGFVADGDVDELMAAAAVVVLPYRELDSSGVLATAIGYGRPVVVTDVGSLGEQVREFHAGRVVPPGDSVALAEACNSLLLAPEELRRAAEGAAAAAAALTWDASAEAHERLYGELVR
jgi:glycosyltransferase involved in cell wall biosynthesis